MSREVQQFDRSSKWLIQHHGDAIVRLATSTGIRSFRPAQAEVVQPRQLPDGLLEVQFVGAKKPTPVLLEIASYPEKRVVRQVLRNAMLVYLDRDEWPEMIVLTLAPKGKYRLPCKKRLASQCGLSSFSLNWRVVELWNVPADELLAAGDVGLVPWVLLAKSSEPPEQLARRCRDTIDLHAPPGEHENLLAVTQVLTGLRYRSNEFRDILGGRKAMIDSPVLKELISEEVEAALQSARQADILDVLRVRFGVLPQALQKRIKAVTDVEFLSVVLRRAVKCPDLKTFERSLK